MSLSIAFPQASLTVAMLVSAAGTYVSLSPPNPVARSTPSVDDTIRRLHLASKHTTEILLAPLGLLALQTSSLALLYPHIPPYLLRYGAENGLNPDLVTWSAATSVPLALILCVGIPLRQVPYASLGRNFTFTLTPPDRLTTTGIYRYVQHPGYVGIIVLIACNFVLLGRTDGVLSCWIPPNWHQAVRKPIWVLESVAYTLLVFAIRTRIGQEERMLRAKFGVEWEGWHEKTARFIPWIF